MTIDVDYLVLGAGPAGLQLAYFLEQANRDYLVLEAGEAPGTFFQTFPRHRQLISINKPHTGYTDPEIHLRWDWNSLLCDAERLRFPRYSSAYLPAADTMLELPAGFRPPLPTARALPLACCTRWPAKEFPYRGSGRQSIPQPLPDRGDRLFPCVHSGHSRDRPRRAIQRSLYRTLRLRRRARADHRQRQFGVRAANCLLETAAAIHLASPSPIKMAWQTHFVGNLRAVNNDLLDTYQLKSQNVVINATVQRIERDGKRYRVRFAYTRAHGEEEVLSYDRVIACTGFQFDSTPFSADARPELVLDGRFPAQTPHWQSVNVPDLFFCGTLMQALDYRKSTSGFIHGFRYNIRALHRILEHRYHGAGWPCRVLRTDAQLLTEQVLKRMNATSALWQQFGFLGDVIALDRRSATATHYEELPVDYVRAGGLAGCDDYFLLTLEYGKDHVQRDPFAAERIARDDTAHAHKSSFLHPVVRRCVAGRTVSEHHVIEDLAAEWREPEHVEPLTRYFAAQLG